MSYLCAASTRPTLSSALQSIFYAEFAPGRHFPGRRYQHARFSLNHQINSNRYFSSSRRLLALELDEVEPISKRSTSPPSSEPSKAEKPAQPEGSKSREHRKLTGKSNNIKDSSKATETSKAEQAGPRKKKREGWQIQKDALREKFKEGWNPRRKLSPDAIEGIRQLHAYDPVQFKTPVLAQQFQISPEAIRRILKNKWRPTEEEAEHRRKRWNKRHAKIWGRLSEIGVRMKRGFAKPHENAKVLYEDNKWGPHA